MIPSQSRINSPGDIVCGGVLRHDILRLWMGLGGLRCLLRLRRRGRRTRWRPLRALARPGKDATQNARLSMVVSGLEGVGRAEAGRMVGMDGQRDGARSRDLASPANLVLLELPPYSPEPDPMETVFQYPKGNRLANRVFADAAAVAEACRKAWDRFAAMPDRIAAIMRRE